jgi:soluble lytic murein transglycosylase-like protein
MALPALTKLVPLAFSMAFGFAPENGTAYQGAFLANANASKIVVSQEATPAAPAAPVALPEVAIEAGPKDAPDAALLELVRVNAEQQGIDPLLVEIVIKHESAFDPEACSGVGASGLMQLMPETAYELGVTDLNDPAQNVAAGTKYLAQQLEKYDNDVQLALAAYNAGPGNVDYYGGIPPFEETQNYAHSISSEYWERSAQ